MATTELPLPDVVPALSLPEVCVGLSSTKKKYESKLRFQSLKALTSRDERRKVTMSVSYRGDTSRNLVAQSFAWVRRGD